jgi:hypothetical protein
MGQAITMATNTHFEKSLNSWNVTNETLAPKTFRIQISLVRFSVMKEERPNKPKQEIKMAMMAK